MPKLNDNLEKHTTGAFQFSAARLDDLEASEYTLVTVVVDQSGSVYGFKNDMEACIKNIVKACRLSPRADNLMLRFLVFATRVVEEHGFKLLAQCNPDDYQGVLRTGGVTALYDASENAVASTTSYGKTLIDNNFDVNGIVFVITDGLDNNSTHTKASVRKAFEGVVADETLESMVSVLIGVNIQDAFVSEELKKYHVESGFTQYVEMQNAEPKTLAKLADFVSRSISSQSQSLGTGGASQPLTF